MGEDAISRLYVCKSADFIRYAALVLGNHADAEDAVQDVFRKMVASGIDHVRSPEPYAWTAVRRKCTDMLLRKSRSPVLDQIEMQENVIQPGGAGIPADISDALARAVGEMLVDERDLLLDAGELTCRELAAKYGVTVSMVNVRVYRVRRAAQAAIEKKLGGEYANIGTIRASA